MPTSVFRAAFLALVITAPLAGQGLDGTQWRAERIGARPAGGARGVPTLRFEGGRLAAFDGCNRLMGPVTVTAPDGIAIGRLAGTMMACPGELANQATAFGAALAKATRVVVQGERLVLRSADGRELAAFVRQSSALAGSAWVPTMINNGKGAVASTLAGTTLRLAFDAGGAGSASAGCNDLAFRYEQRGDTLAVGPVRATGKRCPAPAGIMEQEAQLIAALGKATRVRVEGDRLELRDAGGALQVSARRAPPPAGGASGAPDAAGGMGGEFTYLADAAAFTDCRTGRRVPVAMERAWIDVERAYLAAGRRGAPLYAVIDGAILERSRMEGSGTMPTLVVSRLVGTFPLMRCARARGTAALANTYWRVVRLADEAVTPVGGRREAHLIIRRDQGGGTRFYATVGCNAIGGAATVAGDAVTFTPGPSTLMACPDPLGARERAFQRVLREARSARIVAETMELRDAQGRPLALFESVYM